MNYPGQDKQQLRQLFRRKRRSLSPQQQKQAGEAVAEQISQLLEFQLAELIAIYLPNDGEISTLDIIQICRRGNKQVALPVVDSTGLLNFVIYPENAELRLNQFAIPEPVLNQQTLVPVEKLDVICLPLVAFDLSGNRLGMGGGFYDRTLAQIPDPVAQASRYPCLIGLAHTCQQSESLPIESWDIPLNYIVTPTAILQPS